MCRRFFQFPQEASHVIRFWTSRSDGIGQITGTIDSVEHAADVTTISIEILRASIPDSLVAAADYIYQIERQSSDGKLCVELQGNLALNRRTV